MIFCSTSGDSNASSRVIPFVVLVILILSHLAEPAAKKAGKGKAKSRSRVAAALDQSCAPGQAFHNDTEKCHDLDTQGPCSEQMKFYIDPEAEGFGDCDCEKSKCGEDSIAIYWAPDDRCYNQYEIGPCEPNQWLVANATGDSECQINPCLTTPKAIQVVPEKIDDGLLASDGPDGGNTTMGYSANTEIEIQMIGSGDGICQCSKLTKVENNTDAAEDCKCTDFIFKPSAAMANSNNFFTLLFILTLSSLLIWHSTACTTSNNVRMHSQQLNFQSRRRNT